MFQPRKTGNVEIDADHAMLQYQIAREWGCAGTCAQDGAVPEKGRVGVGDKYKFVGASVVACCTLHMRNSPHVLIEDKFAKHAQSTQGALISMMGKDLPGLHMCPWGGSCAAAKSMKIVSLVYPSSQKLKYKDACGILTTQTQLRFRIVRFSLISSSCPGIRNNCYNSSYGISVLLAT